MLENIKIKNSTLCDCGRKFIINDIQKLERIDDKNFYSGIVKHYSKTICPECGKEVVLLLKQVGQTYKVLNIAEKSNELSAMNVEMLNEIESININEDEEIEPTIKNEEEIIESNELI